MSSAAQRLTTQSNVPPPALIPAVVPDDRRRSLAQPSAAPATAGSGAAAPEDRYAGCIIDPPTSGQLRTVEIPPPKSFVNRLTSAPSNIWSGLKDCWQRGPYRATIESFARAVLGRWSAAITSQMVVRVHDDARDVLAQNAIWAVKHVVEDDFVNVTPLFGYIDPAPSLYGITKTLTLKEDPFFWLLSQPVRPFVYPVQRAHYAGRESPDAVRVARQHNESVLAKIRSNLEKSGHAHQIVIFPEGTINTDGSVTRVQNGVFEIGRQGTPVIPVGITYDFFAGTMNGKTKQARVFVNVGKPFRYNFKRSGKKGWPLVRERVLHYVRDMPGEREVFRQTLSDRLVELSTITCAALVGESVLYAAKSNQQRLSLQHLTREVEMRAQQLKEMAPIDEEMLEPARCQAMVQRTWDHMETLGYIAKDPHNPSEARVCPDKILSQPNSPDGRVDPLKLVVRRAYRARQAGDKTLEINLADLVVQVRDEARRLENVVGRDALAPELKEGAQLLRYMRKTWNVLIAKGWIVETEGRTARVNIARVLEEAPAQDRRRVWPFTGYQKENPLRFCANALFQRAKKEPAISRVLESTRYASQGLAKE